MAAYLIFFRETPIADEEAMKQYRSGGGSVPIPADLKMLVRNGTPVEAIEGEPPDGVVVIRFDNAQSARDWYNSPEYTEHKKLRQKAAQHRAVLVEGPD